MERGLFFINWNEKTVLRRSKKELVTAQFLFGHVDGHRDKTLINRNTDFIRTIFLYTVLNVVVMNMMECYY